MVKSFPETRFTACDLDRDGVDFCGAICEVDKAYSRVDLNEFSLGQQFDFIWSGSLITHFDAAKISALLDFFARHLSVGGSVVFTAAGEQVQQLVNGQFDYGISRGKIPLIVKDYNATGYGYTDYPPYRPNYGISLTSPDWIDKKIHTLTGANLTQVYFEPHAWDNHQDVYGYVKS